MADEHDMYISTAFVNRVHERIVKHQEELIKLMRNKPDDTVAIEFHEAIIRELKSLIQ